MGFITAVVSWWIVCFLILLVIGLSMGREATGMSNWQILLHSLSGPINIMRALLSAFRD
jgi:hypothetical protein